MKTGSQARWYKNMRKKMNRLVFQRKLAEKAVMDESPDMIFFDQVKRICAAFARGNDLDCAKRKWAIKTLWRCAGRGGEPSLLTYEGVRWNEQFEAAVCECPQPKSSKTKSIPMVAGSDRHADWCLDFGDVLVLVRGGLKYDSEENTPFFPELLPAGGSTTKLSNYIKGIAPQPVGMAKYAHIAVSGLPSVPTAGGIRPGAADMLAASVPAEIAVHTTGHDLENLSALWNYLDCRVALTIPGAIALSGFPPLPYGQLGQGPSAPSLNALVVKGVALDRLEVFIDEMFVCLPRWDPTHAPPGHAVEASCAHDHGDAHHVLSGAL